MFTITTERQENENYNSYLKRIVAMAADKQITYTEMGDALLGIQNTYSADNLRKAFYVINKVVENIDTEQTNSADDVIKEIEQHKEELYKETVRYRDKIREYRKLLTEEARFENLTNCMIEELRKKKPYSFEKCILYPPIPNLEASLLVADIHYGLKVDNQLNYYDCDTAVKRLNELADKTIHYCTLHKVHKLNVELLGDFVNGIINTSNRVEQEEDIISQIVQISDILSKMIVKLAKNIPEIKVLITYGNHGRVTANKKDHVNRENFERLVYHYIKMKIPQIKVISSMNDDYIVTKIDGKKVVLTHGDKPSTVKDFVNILGYKPDEIHCGHYHSFTTTDDCDTDVIITGSLVSTDDYALSIRKSTKASQTLRIYDYDVCTYKIVLN